jgi:hypothetical protein
MSARDTPEAPAVDVGAVEREREAGTMIATGIGIGALGAAMAAVGGAICPVCVVAGPALVGLGAFRRWRARRGTRPPGSRGHE